MAMFRLRRRNVRRTWLLTTTSSLVAALILFVVGPAVANLPGSPFDAGDGNLVLNDEAQDWANAPNLRVGIDLASGAGDNSFGQGAKEDTEVPSVVDGSIPPGKSDLLRFYVANQRVDGDEFLYLAWERVQEPQGTTNMDFEFNQSSTVSPNGVTPLRTAGDVLIKYDLARGGTTPILGFHLWVVSGNPSTVCESSNTVPCWGRVQELTGDFEGSINSVPVVDPIPPDAPRTLSERTFGEAAINLTDSGIFPPGTCEAFSGAYLKSRSSDSFTAELKDFIAPIPVNIRNCGRILIDKVTDPSGDPQSFAFTLTGGPSNLNQSFSLTDAAAPHDSGPVLAGSGYNAAEIVPAGWDLVGTTCSDGSPVTNIDVAADETVTCTFTDRKRGRILIDKVTDPSGHSQSFDFTLGGGPSNLNQSFSLTDAAAPHDSGVVLPGSGYSAAEAVPTGWELVSAVCSDGSPVANIDVGAGETVTCTFTDRTRGRIIIDKVTDPAGDPQSFDFSLTGGPSGLNQSFGLTDAAAPHDSGPVVPGSGYSAAETVPAGWDLVSATCDDGSPVTNIDVGVGETVTCTFRDRKRGRILVDKVTDPSGDPQSFAFTLSGGPSNLNQSFSLTDAAAPHDSGAILPGSGYSAEETVPAGWELVIAVCNDGSPVTNIDVGAGETVTCTFTDRARGSINIHKEDDAGNALAGAVFTLFVDNLPFNGLPPHGAEDAATTKTCTTDASGNCSITDIVPGQYWVVETTGVAGHATAADENVVIGAGTTLTLTFVDPRLHVVIVLVCHQGTNTLAASDVTNGSGSGTSLATPPAGITEAQLCALGGARFADKPHGPKGLTVDVGSDAHP